MPPYHSGFLRRFPDECQIQPRSSFPIFLQLHFLRPFLLQYVFRLESPYFGTLPTMKAPCPILLFVLLSQSRHGFPEITEGMPLLLPEVSLFSHVLPELFSFLPPKNDKQTILPPHYSSKTPAAQHKKDNHAGHQLELAFSSFLHIFSPVSPHNDPAHESLYFQTEYMFPSDIPLGADDNRHFYATNTHL